MIVDVSRGAPTLGLPRSPDTKYRSILEIMDFREVTGIPIVARAVRYATKADILRLRSILKRMKWAVSGGRYVELDTRFHRQLAIATHNPLLVKIVAWVSFLATPTRVGDFGGQASQTLSLDGHRAIVKCIRERDPEEAAAAT